MVRKHDRLETIDTIVAQAEAQSFVSDDPIPPRRLPGVFRWMLRLLFYPFVCLDLLSQWLARKIIRPKYIRSGSCRQRGNCCRFITIAYPKGFWNKLYYYWHTEVNGFYPRKRPPLMAGRQKMKIMGCRYLKEDGSCANHKFRPMICRQWPMEPMTDEPRILKGCGYTFTLRKK